VNVIYIEFLYKIYDFIITAFFNLVEGAVHIFHYVFGIIFLVIDFLQHACGGVLKVVGDKKKGIFSFLGSVKKIHLFTGWFLYVFGKIMIITGGFLNYSYLGTDESMFFLLPIISAGVGIIIQIVATM
jgi:hypothetical protein